MLSYGAENVARVLKNLTLEQARLNGHLAAFGTTVDEFALLVCDRDQLQILDNLLSLDFGWERFNVANDEVRTSPIRSNYSVEYHFFRHSDHPYRLEVMRLTSGLSPLHAAIPPPLSRQVCAPVHASFKCEDEEKYLYARDYVRSLGYAEAQRCDSSYGRFSYWTSYSRIPSIVPYLKPRVNLRDTV